MVVPPSSLMSVPVTSFIMVQVLDVSLDKYLSFEWVKFGNYGSMSEAGLVANAVHPVESDFSQVFSVYLHLVFEKRSQRSLSVFISTSLDIE